MPYWLAFGIFAAGTIAWAAWKKMSPEARDKFISKGL